MHRLFFALWPDATLRRGIAEAAEANPAVCKAGGRAEAADRYHLTLRFLGDFDVLPPGTLDALGAAATGVAIRSPFELLLDRIGSFGAGRVVWMGCQAPPPQLVQLHRELGEALAAADIASKESSAFVPHLTLRRHAHGTIEQTIPPLRWWARGFVLIDSTAGAYRIVGRWPLAGA
jgi:2'-5' RNA ligase